MAFAAYTPFFVLFFLTNLLPSSALSAKPFPCFFIFGDSLVDSGNNNDLDTSAKANYSPYGVDFPNRRATGRFTNGRTTADFLAQMLGFDNFIPPFAEAQDGDIINGLNYASGSAGIRRETGEHLGVRISLDQQLQNHEITLSRLDGNVSSAKQRLDKCFYYFVVGSNDYINNYYLPENYPTSTLYSPQEYVSALIKQYYQQLKKSYDLGARKIGVAGVGPLGCVPAMLARGTNDWPCVDSINDAAKMFNNRLQILVDQLNDQLKDAKFIYISAMDLRPTELFDIGIRLLSDPCCKVMSNGLCIPGVAPCAVRDVHFFYDYFHPTEIVYKIVATASYLDILKLI